MTSGRPPPGHVPADHDGLRVAVVSDRRLVSDTVAAALESRGLDVVVEPWPLTRRGDLAERTGDAAVTLLLYEVDDLSLRLSRARTLLQSWPGSWVVLTCTPPGPAWGGLWSVGAAAVAPSDLPLAELDRLVRQVAAGEEPPGVAAREEQVAAWRVIQERHGQLQLRLDSLAPREREVLELLRRGVLVVEIAREWGLAEATVRTHVRAILRKLDVPSQLAALALLREVDEAGAAAPSPTQR